MPKIVEVELESITPYSSSRMHETEKLTKERPDEYDARTWREKCTTDESGQVVVPAMAFKQALDAMAKMGGMQIPGKGKSTYTKHFLSGVLCESDVPLGVHKNDVASVRIHANADGIRGSGKRVMRVFPIVPKWKSKARFVVMADEIGRDVFEKHLTDAGLFIGIGRFRPERGGMNGRFRPGKFTWTEV